MGENEQRRQARRQKRGALRVEEILQVAGTLFAEVGYDNATTVMIAARAELSPGSLYQYFPNKEAIAQAYMLAAVQQLQQVYDNMLAPDVLTLPLATFIDTLIDLLLTFNRSYPGYLALSVAATLASESARLLADMQQGLMARLDALFAVRWPESTAAARRLSVLISYRLFISLLPLALQNSGEQSDALVRELKLVLYRYLAPGIG